MKTPAPIYGVRAAIGVLVIYLVVTPIVFLVNRGPVGSWETTLASILIQVVGVGFVVTALVTIWRSFQGKLRQNQVR